MRRLLLADLRDSWSAWLGVSLTFISANFAICLALLVRSSVDWSAAQGLIPLADADDGQTLAGFNAGISIVTTLGVVGAATALVVTSRRGAISRLGLAGATPGQVVRLLVAQLVATSLACAVLGDVAALLALHPVLRFLAHARGTAIAAEHLNVPAMLLANGLCAVASVAGGQRQARAGSRIPPVEALRAASGLVTVGLGRRTLQWLGVVASAVLLGLAVLWGEVMVRHADEDAMAMMLQVAVLLMPLAGAVLAAAAPLVTSGLTRAWTSLVPVRGATWLLARSTVIARGDRLARTVVPVMFAVGLPFGMMAVTATFMASARASGSEVSADHTDLSSLLTLIGLPIVISICSSVGALVMMSRQRSAEVALDGVLGATPPQQVAVTVLEALIVTVTATLLSFGMVAVSLVYLAIQLPTFVDHVVVSLPLSVLGVIFAIALAVAIGASALPTLPTLRRPAPEVIARLVAA